MRSPSEILRPMRRSLNSTHGLMPALRPRVPSNDCNVGVPPAAKTAKHGSWKKPVGENREGTAGPQPTLGAFPDTIFGRPVSGENWKLSGLPVRILNGLPEATSMMGASVQLLRR